MRVEFSLLFMQCILYFKQHDFVFGKPMFGENVRDVEVGEFPYVVSITWNRAPSPDFLGVHICTGLLITRMDVLTCAHCFDNATYDIIDVMVGSIDLTNATRFRTSWWITYNEWASFCGMKLNHKVNDVGNLRLCEPVPSNVQIATLSDTPASSFYEKEVAIAAWGRNTENVVPNRMRTVKLKVLRMGKCRKMLKVLNDGESIKLHDRFLCSIADPYAVMHHGDSGGPVIFMNTVIAIHKSTMPFPRDMLNPRKINVHTGIEYYRHFIDIVINPGFDWLLNPGRSSNRRGPSDKYLINKDLKEKLDKNKIY